MMKCQTCRKKAAYIVDGGKISLCSYCATAYFETKESIRTTLCHKCGNSIEKNNLSELCKNCYEFVRGKDAL